MSIIKLANSLEDKSKKELINEYIELYEENEKLKKKLRKYENPHTPPSKDERLISRSNFVSKTGLPVGKQTGYRGATRERKTPNFFINNFDGVCRMCSRHNRPGKIFEKVYEEIPKPQPIKVVKIRWGFYECSCGHCWESEHADTPKNGIIGKNAQAYITLLRFDDRLPLRKTVEAIDRQQGLSLTSKAVYDITKRVADIATPEYENMKIKIRKAKHLNIDETKIKVQGFWYYLWIFRSEKYVFFVIRRERNRNVLDEILGHCYRGSITCDGLSAYEEYTKYLQRCWAHILRETKEYADKYDNAKPMHKWMKDLFEKVCSVTIKTPKRKREALYRKCNKEMEQLTQIYSSYQHLGEIITKIKNGLPYWFTRILHPRIGPTNNSAERPLREPVVFKKIIGTLRNEDGAKIFSVIMTLLATWKLQGKDKFIELRALL
ncbi:MAG: IS66 family transposase [Nanoarchaeota archaeon]